MRIIAGSARGRKLLMPDESATRPLLEMARGALFNILGQRVPRARILDLYAGSGALGLEALSRGAVHACFVERSDAAFAALEQNVAACRLASRAQCLQADVLAIRDRLDPRDRFDIIFMDPPFADTRTDAVSGVTGTLENLTGALLAPGGMVVFRLEGDVPFPPSWAGVPLWKERQYGRSRLCLYCDERAG